MPDPLVRSSLRDQARQRVRDLILWNHLPAGHRINETGLAEDLGISRTPLREALNQLEEERFIESSPGQGYFVRGLDPEEAREIYVVLADLEALAVRLAGTPSPQKLAELRELNDRLPVEPERFKEALRINRQWHEVLVGGCSNRYLLGTLASLHRHVIRYEQAYFIAGEKRLRASRAFHREIIEALEGGEESKIRAKIENHWLSDLDFLTP